MRLSNNQHSLKRALIGSIAAIGTVSVVLVSALIRSGTAAPAEPSSIARIEMSDLLGSYGYALECSPVFVSEDSVGLLVRSALPNIADPTIGIVNWQKRSVVANAAMQTVDYVRALHAVSGGRIIVEGRYKSFLYSSDLNDRELLPLKSLVPPVPRSNMVGEQRSDSWRVYQMKLQVLTSVREGQGELQSVFENLIVFRHDNLIITLRLPDRPIGSFDVTPTTAHQRVVEIIGGKELYIAGTPNGQLVSFEGKVRLQVRPPPGWGFRHGQSADGTRMLFDHYTRVIPGMQKVGEEIVSALTLGLGRANETDNTEAVTVLDTRSGAVCLDLETPGRLFGNPGGWHADISPSGRFVAVSTPDALSIYKLSDNCGER